MYRTVYWTNCFLLTTKITSGNVIFGDWVQDHPRACDSRLFDFVMDWQKCSSALATAKYCELISRCSAYRQPYHKDHSAIWQTVNRTKNPSAERSFIRTERVVRKYIVKTVASGHRQAKLVNRAKCEKWSGGRTQTRNEANQANNNNQATSVTESHTQNIFFNVTSISIPIKSKRSQRV